MHYICHHTDNDGYCGATVIYRKLRELSISEDNIMLIKCNYGFNYDKFIDGLNKDDIVYIVDYSFDPDVFKIIVDKVLGSEWDGNSKLYNIIWIDHHDSAIKKYNNTGWNMDSIPGLRSTYAAGCELAYMYCNPKGRNTFFIDRYSPECLDLTKQQEEIDAAVKRLRATVKTLRGDYEYLPRAIAYAGDWDTWTFAYKSTTRLFNAGLKMHDTRDLKLWEDLINSENNVEDIIEEGKVILNYETKMYERMCGHGKFEFTDAIGRTWLCLNSAIHSSMVFGEEAANTYDFLLCFSNCHNEYWSYSIYSTKHDTREVDFAGYHSEGHPGASGFKTEVCIIDKDIASKVK